MAAFFKTTILGGILFLLPLAIVLMILGYLLKLAATVAKPIADRLEGRRLGRCGRRRARHRALGPGAGPVSFGAGIVARTLLGARITRWFKIPCSAVCLSTRC